MASTQSSRQTSGWTINNIRALVEKQFGKRACWIQLELGRAIYNGKDVVGVAATGAGKTLSFWIALLMALAEGRDVMAIVVTPLNLIGEQNQTILNAAGLPAISVTRENSNPETYKDIMAVKYRIVSISPELLNEGLCSAMWNNTKFTSKIMYLVFDEAHCIALWASFRSQYLYVGNIRHLIPEGIPFYIASATLSPPMIRDISATLRLRPSSTEQVLRSNDRPTIYLACRVMEHPSSSYRDLAFLVPDGTSASPPPKFLVFFESTASTENAVLYLRSRLPQALRDRVRWFHSTMTPEYRKQTFQDLRDGTVWGLAVTDAFGLGLDLPDVQIVVQYGVPSDMDSLIQRFGRAARAPGTQGVGVLLAEKKFFDDERLKRATSKAKRQARKQPRGHQTKRQILSNATNHPIPAVPNLSSDEESSDTSDEESCQADISTTQVPSVNNGGVIPFRTDEERRTAYHTKQSNSPTDKKKGVVVTIGSSIDDFINAPTRAIPCRRRVITLHYDNDRRSHGCLDHRRCDTQSPTGCSRCTPQPIMHCCDVCNPNIITNLMRQGSAEKPPRTTKKSSIKPFIAGEPDRALEQSLIAWRDERAVERYGKHAVRSYGSTIFISDATIERIVACAHAKKLTSVASLCRETNWHDAAKYGQDILDLIEKNIPFTVADVTLSRTLRKCSACGSSEHISSNIRCPARAVRPLLVNKENNPPVTTSTYDNPPKKTPVSYPSPIAPAHFYSSIRRVRLILPQAPTP